MKKTDLVQKMLAAGQLPHSLFKYRSLSGESKKYTLDIFRKCELYFAAPKSFNDPFDCNLPLVLSSREELAESIALRQTLGYSSSDVRKHVLSDKKIKSHIKRAVDRVMNSHGVCCFSRKCDDILMWSHYGDCHRGICLEFDVSEEPGFFVFPQNVKYQDSYPLLDVSQEDGIQKYIGALISTKYSAWAYEEEVRVYKVKNHPYSFNPKILKSVIFGCKSDDTTISEVLKVVRDNDALSHVRFYKVVMDDKAYKLNLIDTF